MGSITRSRVLVSDLCADFLSGGLSLSFLQGDKPELSSCSSGKGADAATKSEEHVVEAVCALREVRLVVLGDILSTGLVPACFLG